jgi:hypothetical protein
MSISPTNKMGNVGKRKIEARSRNNCGSGKAISVCL